MCDIIVKNHYDNEVSLCSFVKRCKKAVCSVFMPRLLLRMRFIAQSVVSVLEKSPASNSNMTPASESHPVRKRRILMPTIKTTFLYNTRRPGLIPGRLYFRSATAKMHLQTKSECQVRGLCALWSLRFRQLLHRWSFWIPSLRLYRQRIQSSRWLPHG